MGINEFIWASFILIAYHKAVSTNVSIYTKITSDNKYMIICEAWGKYINSTSVHLNCPLIDSKICYMNCEAPCVMEDDLCQIPASLKPVTQCISSKIKYDHVRYEYRLDNQLIKSSGEWSCTYRGENTRKILIDKSNYNKPTEKPKHEEPLNKRNYDYENFIPPRNDIRKNNYPRDESRTNENFNYDISRRNSNYGNIRDSDSGRFEESRTNDKNVSENYPESFTEPKLVIALLVMLVVSLVVNIIFCLRCVLFKYYSDRDSGPTGDGQPCVEKLLCIESYKNMRHPYPIGKHMSSSRQESSEYEDLNGFGSHRRVPRQAPSAITQIETLVDENGMSYLRYPYGMVPNGIPSSPVPSNRSTSTGHPAYYKVAQNYQNYQNGYGTMTPPPAGNYVLMGSHPLAQVPHRNPHTIYDDVPFELRAQSQRMDSRQGSQYPDSEMNRSVRLEEEEVAANMEFLPPPPPPLDDLPPGSNNNMNIIHPPQLQEITQLPQPLTSMVNDPTTTNQ